jgi:hypothetical protein
MAHKGDSARNESTLEFVCSANILKREYRSIPPLGLIGEDCTEEETLRQTSTNTRAVCYACARRRFHLT